MARERPYVKERNKTNLHEVTFRYVLETIFWISKKSIGNDDPEHAEKILIEASKRGDKGLFVEDTRQIIKELGIAEAKYFHITKTLKQHGLLRKTKGRFYCIYEYADHLSKKSTAINAWLMDHGISR
jgi:hypothetical protein